MGSDHIQHGRRGPRHDLPADSGSSLASSQEPLIVTQPALPALRAALEAIENRGTGVRSEVVGRYRGA
ncbi:hypothetical protein Thiowin_01989 [Thiorhodovibrio winogradskyi]|uniref:Uncharacterized protein n=1 Tax=Thiorhodovibrio winogradskyi TaxID=77007 RepID=A0ABZ0SBN4_9GAMM|nr:hypothetical protein [Thiorhodovibrio winogradskyi]